jgi:hypothetical protein
MPTFMLGEDYRLYKILDCEEAAIFAWWFRFLDCDFVFAKPSGQAIGLYRLAFRSLSLL